VPPSGGGGGGGGGGVPPDLHVELSASATTAPAAGAQLIYSVTVSTANVGSSSAARLALALPAGFTVTKTYSDRGSGCTGAAPTLTCDVAWISPGTSTHVTVWGTVAAADEQVATASVTSLVEPEANPADNTTTLRLAPAAPAPLTPPSTLRATHITTSAITLAWTSSPDTRIVSYRVTRNGARIATTASPTFTASGLKRGTTYVFSVVGIDASGTSSTPITTRAATAHVIRRVRRVRRR
jgi:hypothetical protein